MNEAKTLYERFTGIKPHEVKVIHGGLNSDNFLIDETAVLRIKRPSFDSAYDPNNEFLAEKRAFKAGLSPQLLHFDPTNGTKLTAFIPFTSFLSKPPTRKEVRLVGETIARLHKLDPTGLVAFDPLGRYDIYKQAANISTSGVGEENLRDYIKKIIQSQQLVFAHNDLVRGNILFTSQQVFIIDYEYAGLNHPLFDLASFITENNITDKKLIEAFLSSYYQEKNIPWRDFTIFCRFLDYLWYYWAQAMFNGTGQSIFKTIARIKGQRISKY